MKYVVLTLLLVGCTPLVALAAGGETFAERLVDRGDKLEEKGDQRGAISAYTQAIVLSPSYAYAYASRCQSEWELDENAEAARDCSHAIELDPSSNYAYQELALAQGDLGLLSQAIASADHAIALDPSRAFPYVVRCRIRTDRKDYDEAIADCNRAIAILPTVAMGHFERGRAELENADYPEAESDMSWVIAHHPEESAYYNRALARLHTSHLEGALGDIEHYIAAYPQRGKGYYTKARIELARGNTTAAHDAAEQALRAYQAAGDSSGVALAHEFMSANGSPDPNEAVAGLIFSVLLIFGGVLSALVVWAFWRIFDRAGLPGPLALLSLAPLGFVACLAILAFSQWSVRARNR